MRIHHICYDANINYTLRRARRGPASPLPSPVLARVGSILSRPDQSTCPQPLPHPSQPWRERHRAWRAPCAVHPPPPRQKTVWSAQPRGRVTRPQRPTGVRPRPSPPRAAPAASAPPAICAPRRAAGAAGAPAPVVPRPFLPPPPAGASSLRFLPHSLPAPRRAVGPPAGAVGAPFAAWALPLLGAAPPPHPLSSLFFSRPYPRPPLFFFYCLLCFFWRLPPPPPPPLPRQGAAGAVTAAAATCGGWLPMPARRDRAPASGGGGGGGGRRCWWRG